LGHFFACRRAFCHKRPRFLRKMPLLFGLRRFLPDFPPEFSVFSLKIIFFHYIIKKKE